MACLWCGTHESYPLVTTRGENPGRLIRSCRECIHHWDDYGPVLRPLFEGEGSALPAETLQRLCGGRR